jgi:NAD(P)-dependent dehydrogenase (short-subunit alcohol dehydrogenase family)
VTSASATDRFDGRRALVTGGASGIGRASAELLLERGARVALFDLDAGRVAETADALGAGGGFATDVRDETAVADALGRVADALVGPADLLVNAAGVYRIAPAAEIDRAGWDEVLETNLRGSFVVAREFARGLRTRPTGAVDGQASIVNLASTAALVADVGEPAAHYTASKAGIVALTKQLAVEWAGEGIRVNAVAPGVIDTPMLRLMDDPAAGREYLDARVPLRRLGRASEVAEVALFLLSERAAYVTGTTVVVDGGVTAA